MGLIEDEPAAVEGTVAMSLGEPRIGAALGAAAVYAFGGALPRALSLLTLPIFTRVLAPSEYGTFALLISISTAVALLLALGLDVAIFRLYFQLEGDEPARVRFVGSIWLTLTVVPLLGAAAIGAIAAPFIHHARFSVLEFELALVGAAMSVAATTAPLSILRADQRLKAFIAVSFTAAISVSGLSLLFVAVFRWGVAGWVAAGLIANAINLLIAGLVVPFRWPTPFSRRPVIESIRFGLPLVPHSFAHWALQAADRIVIAGIVSAAALGVYSLAANLALPVLVLVQAINFAFMPSYARAGTGRVGSSGLARIVVLQVGIVSVVTAASAALAPPIVGFVAASTYDGAGALTPWLCLGYGFLGLYFIPMNGISLGGGRTKFVAVASASAAIANIAFLYAAVPRGGIHAAAVADAAAYAILLLGVFVYARKPENPVRYEWRSIGLIVGALSCAYLGAVTTTGASGLVSLGVRTAWIAAGTAVALYLCLKPSPVSS